MIAIRNILVATDFSAPSEAALVYGRNFARAYGATLHVVHVVQDVASQLFVDVGGTVTHVARLQHELDADARRQLESFVSSEDRARQVRRVVLTSSTTALALLAYALEERIDLIVIGTHGRTGIARFFMGSIAQHVVRMAPCPVLTVHHPEREFVQPDALRVTATVPAATSGAYSR